jgi:hypothetical protein
MRRWIAFAARLYPAHWRGRYGEEFEALLEDHNAGWREFMDVLREAFKMQMTRATGYWKAALGFATAGAIAAIAISFSQPKVYNSTAVIRITATQIREGPNGQQELRQSAASRLSELQPEILSRTILQGIITDPALDLYQGERAREPMENIVARMRDRDLQIRMVQPQGAIGAAR